MGQATPSKSFLVSKTFWWNLASIIYYALGQTHSLPQLDPGTQAIVTAIGNIGLRFITTQPVHLN